MEVKVKIKSLHKDFKMPVQAHAGDAGFDLVYCGEEDILLRRGQREMISCGFAMELPYGWEAQVRSRSGLAAKNGVVVLNSPGTIDCAYRGEVKVVLYNSDISDYMISHGDRIAQLVVAKTPTVSFEEVEELTETDRNEGGFGSTGK